MKKDKPIIAKSKAWVWVLLLSGGAVFTALGYSMIKVSLNTEFVQVVGLGLGLAFGITGLTALYGIWRIDNYILQSNKLIVKSIFNRTKRVIQIDDIRSYNEIEKESKYFSWTDLTLFTSGGRLKMTSLGLSNFVSLKNRLVPRLKRDIDSEDLWRYKHNRKFGYGFAIVGCLMSLMFFYAIIGDTKEYHKNDLITIEGVVSRPLKLRESGKKGRSKSISVYLNEYPAFVFEIAGSTLDAAHSESMIKEIVKGDLVKIDLLADTYEKKILRTKEMSFWDKSINFQFISIFGLQKNDMRFLSLNLINEEVENDSKNNGWIWWLLLLFFIGTTGYGISSLLKKKTAVNNRYTL